MHDHDAVGEDPVEHDASTRDGTRAAAWTAGALLLLGYGWWAVGLPAFSAAATAAVLLAGGAGALVGVSRPARRWPVVDARRAVPWAVVVAAGGAWQLAAYLQHPREDHPTLSSLLNGLLDSHPARAAAFVVWVVATVVLARR